VLEAVVWVAYVAVVGTLFIRKARRKPPTAATPATETVVASA